MRLSEAMEMFEKIKRDFPDNAEGLYMYAQVWYTREPITFSVS